MSAPVEAAYLGPADTNTHEVARALFAHASKLRPLSTIERVFDAVEQGEVPFGVVPIENSIAGTVRETVDALITGSLRIAREHELAIRHTLAARPKVTLRDVRRVLSKDQALSQCRRWLDAHGPDWERIPSTSTAQAAKDVLSDPEAAAIAPPLAVKNLGLSVLCDNIADRDDNATRFVVVAREDSPPSPRAPGAPSPDKTSLVFVAPHERGGLRKVLGVFDDAFVNLTRIESRPLVGLHGPRWEYAFVVDAEGHRLESPLREALEGLDAMGALVKVLGSYPRARASVSHALDLSQARPSS
jgi:chorismate mutase/prephenate dehydratase